MFNLMLGSKILGLPWEEAKNVLATMKQEYQLITTTFKQKIFAVDNTQLYVVRVVTLPANIWQITLAAKMVKSQ